jgi:hypothetical protein
VLPNAGWHCDDYHDPEDSIYAALAGLNNGLLSVAAEADNAACKDPKHDAPEADGLVTDNDAVLRITIAGVSHEG